MRGKQSRSSELVAARKREIISQAAWFLRRKDYFGFSIDDLCLGLRINKTTFYRYFKSKENLLFELHDAATDELEAMMRAVSARSLSIPERLRALIVGQVTLQQQPGVSALTIPQLYVFSPAHRRKVLERRDRYEAAVRQWIAAGVADGTLRDVDPKMGSILLLSTVSAVQNWYRTDGPMSAEQVGNLIADSFLVGLINR